MTKNLNTKHQILLSICIATYNRENNVLNLITDILSLNGNFEICVHIDGSTDNTKFILEKILDERLRVTEGNNNGRASALMHTVTNARGKYIMLFDDDDSIYPAKLKSLLLKCKENLPDNICGYIYHMDDINGHLIGDKFTLYISNFIALRADHKIQGDKKEIIRSDIITRAILTNKKLYKRIPTSLYWSRIALNYDVYCINESIGIKRYLNNGLTSKIKKLKFENAYPMLQLKKILCLAFFKKRYINLFYLFKAILGIVYYGTIHFINYWRHQ